MSLIKDPWNVNCFAQLAGVVSLKDKEYIKKTKNFLRVEKRFLYCKLKELPKLKVYEPSVNYIFIDISDTGYTSTKLQRKLAKEGILIRNCNSYKQLGEDFIRVAVKNRDDNTRLLHSLHKVLG